MQAPKLGWSDVTPKAQFLNRRALIAGAGAVAFAGAAGIRPALAKIDAAPSAFSTDATPNTLEDITSYNNFYEFGTGKEDPARLCGGADHRSVVDRDRRAGGQARHL
jgi:methionine sulfoxide reductase catalytic subunit